MVRDHAQNPWKILLNKNDVGGLILYANLSVGISEASLARVPRCLVFVSPHPTPLPEGEGVHGETGGMLSLPLPEGEGVHGETGGMLSLPLPEGEGVHGETGGMLSLPLPEEEGVHGETGGMLSLPLPVGEGWGEGKD